MKKNVFLFLVILNLFLLQGCSNNSKQPVNTQLSNESIPVSQNVFADKDSSLSTNQVVSEISDNQVIEDLRIPVVKNETGKVLIQTISLDTTYPYNSYVISSVNGENVIADPTKMPTKELADFNPIAVTETHNHPDHVDLNYTKSYPDAQKLKYEMGIIDSEDFHIYSIASSHSDDTIVETEGTNYIIVYEVNGLRIAHMGDIGQTTMTDEQLKQLGAIDIAFMQFDNSFSDMSLENEKGFHLIEQINPKIIIPTHYDPTTTLPVLEEKYGPITEVKNVLSISKEDLPEKSLQVYRILNDYKYH